jgi:hypothetical protein
MRLRWITLVLGFAMGCAATAPRDVAAQAQSLEERKAQERQMALLDASLSRANQSCGANLRASWDWASWHGILSTPSPAQSGDVNAADLCGQALDQLGFLCTGEGAADARDAVKEALHAFTCRGGAGAGAEARVAIAGGALEFTGDLAQARGADVQRYLAKSLIVRGASLQERRARDHQYTKLDGQVRATNGACQTSLAATWEWASWGALGDGSDRDAADLCGAPLHALEIMCSDGEARWAIQRQIKSFTCRGGAGAEARVDLKGSALVYAAEVGQQRAPDTRAYLMKTLKP